jgi:hypothetical protein
LFKQNRDLKKKTVNVEQAAQQEQNDVIAAVGKIYQLPADKPSEVKKVVDKNNSDFKNVAFYKNAENGDYVLFFNDAKVAILYRSSSNKIINVAPLISTIAAKTIGAQAARDAAQQTLQTTFKSELSFKTPTDAKAQYTEVLVVDVSGKNAAAAQKIADTLKGKVVTLPAGEDKPTDVDILIIAGTPPPPTP